jgi:hypothetical protein
MTPYKMIPLCLCVSLSSLLLVAMAVRAADHGLQPLRSPWESAQLRRSDHGYAPLIPAQDTVWCFCPAVLCSHGRMAGCTASCYAPKSPLCRCEAQCDLYEKPVGSNLCRCE